MPDVSASSDPIYLAIAKALAADVAGGRLKPGDRLPTHRELARALNLSIGTVTRGYVEAERRGLIRGETGRGTFVRDLESSHTIPYAIRGSGTAPIDLSANYPLYSEDPDLAAALAALCERDVSHLLRYVSGRPHSRHLEAGAAWMRTFGLDVQPDSLVIASGAQHALAAILFSVTEPGDLILADELTYPGLIALAQLRGLRMQGIAMDEEGMIPEALLAGCRQRSAQVLYCIPTASNPTSTVLSAERRQKLVDIAKEYDLLIIEDDMLRPLAPDAPPPIANQAPERTFFIASTSKVIAAGLRVAYISTPRFAQQKLEHAVWATMWMPSPLGVEIATLWIEDGTARRTAERKRQVLEARHQIARDILGDYPYRSHPAAYSIWLELPEEWSSAEFAVESARRGVSLSPSGLFVVPPAQPPNAVRISLGAAEDTAHLKTALREIAQMLRCGRQCPSQCV